MKTSGRLCTVRLCIASSQMPSPLQPSGHLSSAPLCLVHSLGRCTPDLQLHPRLSAQGDRNLQGPHCGSSGLDTYFRCSQHGEMEISIPNSFLRLFPFTVSSTNCFPHYLHRCSSGLAAPWPPALLFRRVHPGEEGYLHASSQGSGLHHLRCQNILR